MYLPHYVGFYFAVAKTPKFNTPWQGCKEYAGRALGYKRPKGYVTMTVWNGHGVPVAAGHLIRPAINTRAKPLQEHLNGISKKYHSKARFKVSSVPGFNGCLRIQVPTAWCHNRITAHLLLTHIRHFLAYENYGTTDNRHLADADIMLKFGQKDGLDVFNTRMRSLLKSYSNLLGIVNAKNRWITI